MESPADCRTPADRVNLASFASVLPTLALATVALWLVSLLLRDAGIANVSWGLALVGLTVLYALLNQPLVPRGVLVLGLVVVWGVRLTAHLLWRNWGRSEDPRYAAMRTAWGSRFGPVSLFTVFGFQALLLWLISAPLFHAVQANVPAPLGWISALGVGLWTVGMYFEGVADWQLLRFQAKPENEGKVLATGLWRYSRHPNYFGEFLVWWGMFLIAAETLTGWWTIVSPLLVTFLLLRVSGVPMSDALLRRTLGDYRHYVERTNAFFPWFPR